MKEAFNKFIDKYNISISADKVLLTVSGGVDSVVMANLFYEERASCIIAHCNFNLRDKESDKEEEFVRCLAKKYRFPFRLKSFNTGEYAEKNNLSIQVAARNLRYEFFLSLAKKEKCNYIAVAHNKNDNAETFFINLIRGTGLKGLCGIPEKNKKIIRPLLNITRKEIEEYAKENKIDYKNDSSNNTIKYQRNFIRHRVLPVMEVVEPKSIDKVDHAISNLKKDYNELQKFREQYLKQIIEEDNKYTYINKQRLRKSCNEFYYLYEILSVYGFNTPLIKEIANKYDTQPGKAFYARNYYLLVDREFLILKQIDRNNEEEVAFVNLEEFKTKGEKLGLCVKENEGNEIFKEQFKVSLDLAKIEWPLYYRKPLKGDRFKPLGMKGTKLISDFITDLKLDSVQKENLRLLCDSKKIIWVAGYRISDEAKVDSNTTKTLVLEIIKRR